MTDTTQVVIETNDQTPLAEIFPLYDLAQFDEYSEDDAEADRAREILLGLQGEVDQAMRALVTAEWERRGYSVRWAAEECRVGELADRVRREGDTVVYPSKDADAHADMAQVAIEVWASAWDQLHTASIWVKVTKAKDAVQEA